MTVPMKVVFVRVDVVPPLFEAAIGQNSGLCQVGRG